jgi:hypothetical protein
LYLSAPPNSSESILVFIAESGYFDVDCTSTVVQSTSLAWMRPYGFFAPKPMPQITVSTLLRRLRQNVHVARVFTRIARGQMV